MRTKGINAKTAPWMHVVYDTFFLRLLNIVLRFNHTDDGVQGSGYETLVALILQKPTVRVVYAAGQILAKIDSALTAQQLRTLVYTLLEKAPFYESQMASHTSVPNYVVESGTIRDSDTEDIIESEYVQINKVAYIFSCFAFLIRVRKNVIPCYFLKKCKNFVDFK